MQPVIIRDVKIGEGIPKICIPIIGKTKEEILFQALQVMEQDPDIVEWRVDWFQKVFETDQVIETAKKLRSIIKNVPCLFTFRTLKEGGKQDIDESAYEVLNIAAAESGLVDIVDVEAYFNEDLPKRLIPRIKSVGVKVIASNHDFIKTPEKQEIINKLCKMQEINADILKIAVMPNSKRDVLTLLEATEEMVRCHAISPVITMSMLGIGTISRLSGEIFGSSVTFASAGYASAPGQIHVDKLRNLLSILHDNLI